MAMPNFYEIMLPFLQTLRNGRAMRVREVADRMCNHFDLTDAECSEKLATGERKIVNRTWFASTYLFKAGLISRPQRGFVAISNNGSALLASCPDSISEKLLLTFPSFAKWRTTKKQNGSSDSIDGGGVDTTINPPVQYLTPIEAMEANSYLLNEQLAEELLEFILKDSPNSFESTVLDLMQAMGYGRLGTGRVTGGSGDGGIDGIIDEDKLGLDKIYLQAKRYSPENSVGSKEIQAFKGSLDDHNASKGVFITTSRFSSNARKSASNSSQYRIVLIDGRKLAELMIDYDVGVSTQTTWKLKRIDREYFDPDS